MNSSLYLSILLLLLAGDTHPNQSSIHSVNVRKQCDQTRRGYTVMLAASGYIVNASAWNHLHTKLYHRPTTCDRVQSASLQTIVLLPLTLYLIKPWTTSLIGFIQNDFTFFSSTRAACSQSWTNYDNQIEGIGDRNHWDVAGRFGYWLGSWDTRLSVTATRPQRQRRRCMCLYKL